MSALSPSAFTTIKHSRPVRNQSHESLQTLEQAPRRHSSEFHTKVKDQHVKPHQQEIGWGQQVSRLELLLVPRARKPVVTLQEDSSASKKVNEAIKLCSQWTDIQQLILTTHDLTPNNLAFALYRLGCLATFASRKRLSDLKQSELVPHIFELAVDQLDALEPASLVLLLDGCARLHHQPSEQVLSMIASHLQKSVGSLDARQLPLVLWAFSSLHYIPRPDVLSSLEKAVSQCSLEMSPQGLTLVLGGFQAANHHPSELTLSQLADIVQRKLLLFKPSELSACLHALSGMDFRPSRNFVEAILQRDGGFSRPNALRGPFEPLEGTKLVPSS